MSGMIEDREQSDPDHTQGVSVSEREYYGRPIRAYRNRWDHDLVGTSETRPYRLSYVYLVAFGNRDSDTDYGGIQLRAHTHLHLPDEPPSIAMQRAVRQSAHRAAYMYDSSIQTAAYGYSGDADSRGFLSGFTGGQPSSQASYQNWEIEPISGREMEGETPGAVEWSVEIYHELDGVDLADLAGKADGTANPWTERQHHEPGREDISVAPHKWTIDYYPESRPDYYEIRPPGRSMARERYRDGAGQGKDVYINGLRVGEIDNAGRMWLRKEYAANGGIKYGDRYSRKGLVEETPATYQALRDGGTLYLTGETEYRIDLVTAAAKPDGYQPVDPDDVSPNLRPQSGRRAETYYTLELADAETDAIEVKCLSDRDIGGLMGYSDPPYRHRLGPEQTYPMTLQQFRPISDNLVSPDTGTGDAQTSLIDFSTGEELDDTIGRPDR